MRIFLVSATDYEKHEPLAAFTERVDADVYAHQCDALRLEYKDVYVTRALREKYRGTDVTPDEDDRIIVEEIQFNPPTAAQAPSEQ